MNLADVKKLGELIRESGRSMGMALTSCTVPHAAKPSFELPEDEIEVGIGIHGEPGRRRMKLAGADEIAEMLMEPIISDLPFKKGDDVLLFVNGMGAHRSSSCTSSIARPRRSRSKLGSRSSATWWARTSPAWRWREPRSPC